MSEKEPLYHVRRAIAVADKEGLEDEKEILEQAHNEIVEKRSLETGSEHGGELE